MSEIAPENQTALKRMRKLYSKKDREIIAEHHGVEESHPALNVLLAFCVQYGLDPLGGHVWLVDKNFEGAAATDGEPADRAGVELDVAVTRDGFLTIARADRAYGGMEHDAVRSKDTFTTKRAAGEVEIIHEYPALSEDAGEDYRGEIIGAYAKVYVEGKKPTYYFAWMKEHGQFRVGEKGERIFEESWTYTSAMIIKSAQSVALRLALGITGVVGIDEIRPDQKAAPAAVDPTFESPEAFLLELAIDPELKATLIDEVNSANEAEPNSWSLAKLRMRLGGEDPTALEEAAEKTLREIDQFFEARKSRTAAPA